MAKLTQGTWVLVADGEKYLVMENRGDEDFVDLHVRRKEEQDNPDAGEQAANRPGRMSDSQGNRSAFQDTDWNQLTRDRFAHDIAEWLYQCSHKGMFDRIVLVAAPVMLGEIRQNLHKEVADRVVAEVPKVLTNHPRDEIEKHVKEAVQEAA